MYRIRFHGRGGQGMKTAGRILGTAFFNEGFEVQDAPVYGAERRGAPVFAYVRAARESINERGIIRCPDLVIVADDTLMPVPAAGVPAGVDAHTVLLINTQEPVQLWRERLNLAGPVLALPVRQEVEDRLVLRFIGATCVGAAARLVGVISRAALEQAIRDEITPLGTEVLEQNLVRALVAYDLMTDHAGVVGEGKVFHAEPHEHPEWIDVPFNDARISAPAIHVPATSERAPTGLWRTARPVIDYSHCNRCWWVCSTFCPEGAIGVNAEGYPQIDYEHCKGCMVCVAQCPAHTIHVVAEHGAAASTVEGGGT